MQFLRRLLVLLICLSGSGASITPAGAFEAGFVTLSLIDPVENGPMPAIIVYPTAAAPASTSLGPFTIAAGKQSPPAAGRFPLIVLSHGTGGSMLGHHDSLVAFARAGFIAAAVEHPRDNFRDDSGFATDLQLFGRPHHIKALIDGVLAEPAIGPLIDRERIGMVGHSAGGYTALLVAGAQPDFTLQDAYRAAVAVDPYRKRADAAGGKRFKPDLKPVADARVRAIVLLAPALGYLFDARALADVKVPVIIYRPSADEMVPHPWSAERIVNFLPQKPEYVVLAGAGHFVFLAPCSWSFWLMARSICSDPSGVDRSAIHTRLNADLIAFFNKVLK